MCLFGGAPAQDNSAAVARQQEVSRQHQILAGQGQINNAFSAFDPAYFDKFQQNYLGVFNPQVDQQFGDASRNMRYDAARKGVADSTPGQFEFGNLVRTYGDARRQVAGNAIDATNQQRNAIQSQKTNLFNANNTAADPSLAAQNAVSAAGSLSTAPSYSPLANIFNGAVNGAGALVAGQNNALPAGYAPLFNANPAARGAAASVVR